MKNNKLHEDILLQLKDELINCEYPIDYTCTFDMPETVKIADVTNDTFYEGSSKDIKLIAIKIENEYFLKFKNHSFVLELLNNDFVNIINKTLEINSRNMDLFNSNTKNGKIFKKEILDKKENYKIINTYLFVFIYFWFTDLPLHYINSFLFDKNGEKIEQIASKKLIVINREETEIVINRNGRKFPKYQDLKKWLRSKYKNGNIDFISLINNIGFGKLDKQDGKIYISENGDYSIIDKKQENKIITLEELKEMPYDEYLQTDHWKCVRKDALLRAKYRCQLCSSKIKLHVHHNTYDNRGNEKPEDLIVLCEKCHGKFHNKI